MTKHEVEIEPGLKYTEQTGRLNKTLPVRDCFLWKKGHDDPISGLNLLSFRQRFGAVSVPGEGIGSVETIPRFRRQGYVSILLSKVLEGANKRVKIVYVSDGIAELYEKFGFVNCLAEGYLSLKLRDVERLAGRGELAPNNSLRSFSLAEMSVADILADVLPAMVNLYNTEHAFRPWTHKRHAGWNRLLETQTWRPGSEVIVLDGPEGLAGYAILPEWQFGHTNFALVVDELTARDLAAARVLLVELASRCWQMRLGEFRVNEPLDGLVGRAAQELGCVYHQTFLPSGGLMAAILDRQGLLQLLEPELRRRLPGDGLNALHTKAFAALCRGEIVSDNQELLRMLLGHWSLNDALVLGTPIPAEYRLVCEAWFPGGGTNSLLVPYAHKLDHY
jgi:hypothetical protein